MTDVQRNITVALKTLFDGSGFKSFAKGLKVLTNEAMNMNSVIRQNLTGAYNKLGQAVMFNQRSQKEYWASYMSNVKGATNVTQSFSDQIKKNEGHFNAWALSIMFAGMQMMAIFKQIWSMGQKSFQDVMHSVEGTTTGFDNLQGSMKYLGFIIGEALEPVAEWLTPIVIKIADWVENNKGLFKTFVIVLGVVGTLFFTVGQLVLAFGGIITAAKNIGTIFKFIFGKSFWGKALTYMKGVFVKIGGFLTKLGITGKVAMAGGIVAGIILAIVWIFKLKEAIGSWGDFFKGVLSGLVRLLLGFADIIVSTVLTPIQSIIAAILAVGDALGLGAGSFELQQFVKWKPTFLQDFLKKQQDSEFWAPDKGWAQGGGLTPTFNIQNLNVTSDNVDQMVDEFANMSQTGGI